MTTPDRTLATVRYGEHPSQFAEVSPGSPASVDVPVVLIHGGYWRQQHSLDLMRPLAGDLVSRGRTVWNIEYRRVEDRPDAPDPEAAGGGWPATLDDACAALERLAATYEVSLGSVSVVGHSVGGWLALLAATRLDLGAVVALAPVTDLVATHEQGLGEGAAELFLGAGPDALPEQYAAASPVRNLPAGARQLVVHGTADQRVPIEQSDAYAAAVRTAGGEVDMWRVEGLDHFRIIDPAEPFWAKTVDWIG